MVDRIVQIGQGLVGDIFVSGRQIEDGSVVPVAAEAHERDGQVGGDGTASGVVHEDIAFHEHAVDEDFVELAHVGQGNLQSHNSGGGSGDLHGGGSADLVEAVGVLRGGNQLTAFDAFDGDHSAVDGLDVSAVAVLRHQVVTAGAGQGGIVGLDGGLNLEVVGHGVHVDNLILHGEFLSHTQLAQLDLGALALAGDQVVANFHGGGQISLGGGSLIHLGHTGALTAGGEVGVQTAIFAITHQRATGFGALIRHVGQCGGADQIVNQSCIIQGAGSNLVVQRTALGNQGVSILLSQQQAASQVGGSHGGTGHGSQCIGMAHTSGQDVAAGRQDIGSQAQSLGDAPGGGAHGTHVVVGTGSLIGNVILVRGEAHGHGLLGHSVLQQLTVVGGDSAEGGAALQVRNR